MKTIREWFEQLPEPYRSEALANTDLEMLDEKSPSIWDALEDGFVWGETPQGQKYWDKLYSSELSKLELYESYSEDDMISFCNFVLMSVGHFGPPAHLEQLEAWKKIK